MHTLLTRRAAAVTTAMLVTLAWTGCASLDLPEKLSWDKDDEQFLEVPERVVSFWSDTVMHQKGRAGVRGFGGRVFFYGTDSDNPLKVDGTLIVYAFDAEQDDPGQQKPLKKFVFTADQLANHHSHTKIGDSYNIWLPWDEVGGPTCSVSLVTRFEGRAGGVVISDPIDKLLPGVNANDKMFVRHGQRLPQVASDNGVRPASYSAPEQPAVPSQRRLETDAIDLPPSFSRRLRYAVDSELTDSPELDSPELETLELETLELETLESPRGPSSGDVDRQATRSTWDPVADSPAAGYRFPRFPARRSAGPLPSHDPVRRELHPAMWPSALPPTPRSSSREATAERPSAFPLMPPPTASDSSDSGQIPR